MWSENGQGQLLILYVVYIDCNWDVLNETHQSNTFISVDALNLWVISINWWMRGRTPILICCILLILSIYRQFWSVLWSCCSSFWQFGKQQSMTNPVKVKLGSTFFQMHLHICATIRFIKTCLQRFLDFVRLAHCAPNILQLPWLW